ncbi:capsular polysaccharide biosynthesis protein [Paenibacillus shirakamiensis]|uniref:Capsular polysaccharide biosynthesis protein n=1 Tax=Paenibacillus shirakamiensis TaxID=1265935 RepID=A0ABS4JLI7_9BACL|nr:Wzz/FepE/Etk N-terminal domain-containing protein [Paenibacillus shirakamiensis]MBP2001955.1 capsular polysaccharide biosynthesis protein [Paenibacillus shirakamiensis]
MNIVFLLKCVVRHYIATLITLAICVGGAYTINFFVAPQYQAAASLMANIASGSDSGLYNEFLASQMLTKTYEDAIQSRSVASEVKTQLGLTETVTQLLQKINVRTDPGTLVVHLYVTDGNAKKAVAEANAFADVFIHKSKQYVQSAKVTVLDYADLEQASVPVSPKKLFNIALSILIGIFAALSLSLLLEKRRSILRKEHQKANEMDLSA